MTTTSGIEMLLPALLDMDALDPAALLSQFPPARQGLGATPPDPIVSTATLMCDHMLAFEFEVSGVRFLYGLLSAIL